MALFGSDNNRRPPAERDAARSPSNSSTRNSYPDRGESGGGMRSQHRNQLIGAIILIILGVILAVILFNSNKQESSQESQPGSPVVSPSGGQGSDSLSIETAPQPGSSAPAPEQGQTAGQPGQPAQPGQSTAGAPQNEQAPAAHPQDGTSIAQSTNPDYTPHFGNPEDQSNASSAENQEQAAGTGAETPPAAQQAAPAPKTDTQKSAKERSKSPAQNQKSASSAQGSKEQKGKNTIADKDRTDDGSRALALLEGKAPSAASSVDKPVQSASKVTSGSFNVQLSSVSSSEAARQQRDKLRNSGVSNAYIQMAEVNGKTTYRIKVGPFESREAAQAAQTRLRQLNFADSIITGK